MADSSKPGKPDEKSPEAKGAKPEADAEKKPFKRIEIPLISTPNDDEQMEKDMEELFNEEKVKHRHGGTEPERD